MDNNEINNKEVSKEELEKQEALEEVIELGMEQNNIVEENKRKESVLKSILSEVANQIINIALALVLLLVFDLLLKLFGFYIAEREPIFLIIYVIVNILHRPICEATKLKDTIGRKIMLK